MKTQPPPMTHPVKNSLMPTDILVVIAVTVVSFFLFGKFDVLEAVVEFSAAHEAYEVDEIISSMVVMALCMIVVLFRRWRESVRARALIARQKEELETIMKEIKTLQGIIPICASCKNIRTEDGAWSQLETYIRTHSDAEFSHGLCPECVKKHPVKIKYTQFSS